MMIGLKIATTIVGLLIAMSVPTRKNILDALSVAFVAVIFVFGPWVVR